MRSFVLALALLVSFAARARAQEPTVPPVMVVVLASGRAPVETVPVVQAALVTQIGAIAGGRPVLPLAQDDLRARFAACADDGCRGAMIAELGAVGAIVARLSRTAARGDVTLALDLVDPSSGVPRLPTQTATFAPDAGPDAVLEPMIAAIRPAMFAPPPAPPTLLVTVNVDGATIAIDDAVVGHSPIAAQRLTPGHHVVTITRDGYAGTQRAVDLEAGEQERIDVNLAVLAPSAVPVGAASSAPSGMAAAPQWYEEWWVWVVGAAGVLVVAGVITGAVIASQPHPQPDPMGVALPGIRF